MNTCFISLFGSSGSGKSTFADCFISERFNRFYTPSKEVVTRSRVVNTTSGPLELVIKEYPGHSKRGLPYPDGDVCIVFFDVGSRTSFQEAKGWIRWIRSQRPTVPIIACGNKCDIRERKLTPQYLASELITRVEIYFDVSAKRKINLERPFLYAARVMQRDRGLLFEE